jgi:hypothetical protein
MRQEGSSASSACRASRTSTGNYFWPSRLSERKPAFRSRVLCVIRALPEQPWTALSA